MKFFEEVEDEGQETVDSRWVITRKEKADGKKQKVKGRLVAKGFQEKKHLNLIHQQC